MSPHLPARPLICLALALALAGCGRRGPLEPPEAAATSPAAAAGPTRTVAADRRLRPNRTETAASPTTLATEPGAVVADTPDVDPDEEELAPVVTPSPTPRKRIRAFVVPKDSFVLDPLL